MSIKRQYASDNREFDYASEVLDNQHENTEDELEFRTFETGDGYEIELSMLRPGMCRLTVTAFVDDVRDEEVIVDATFETERAEEIVRTARVSVTSTQPYSTLRVSARPVAQVWRLTDVPGDVEVEYVGG
jgi:hypothetical protein